MIVRMNTFLIWGGVEYMAGEEVDLPADVAAAYVRTGQAEQIKQPIETAALRTTPPKGKQDVRIQAARSTA